MDFNSSINSNQHKHVKFISDRLFNMMRTSGISLSVLSSFATAKKYLSDQDIFDYIAYNDKHVVSMLICSNKIKQTYLNYLYSAFDFYKDYKHDYIQNVIKPAFNQAYPEMDIENDYTSLPNNIVKHNQSVFNALAVLGYGSKQSILKPPEGAISKKESINLNKIGSIELPTAGDTVNNTYNNTASFYRIVEVDEAIYVIIKPDVFSMVGNDLEDVIFNNQWFSMCEDINDNEPSTLQENMFMRIISIVSKNGRDKHWAQSPLGQFFFRVFVM